MTQDVHNLRDARLKKALAHAPDAQDMPAQAIRIAIKNRADDAIRTKAEGRLGVNLAWWKRFWTSTGRASSPWNAAFATVLVGSIITLIWHGQDVPDAAPDERPVASDKVQSMVQPATSAASAPGVQTPSAPAPALAAPARAGGLADQARSAANTAATAPSSAVLPFQWDVLEVAYRGRTVKLSKAQSQSLTAQVRALVASAVDSAALLPTTEPTLQLKWYTGNATDATEVATFSMWAGRFVWQVGGSAAVDGVALSDPLDALLASVTRVLPR